MGSWRWPCASGSSACRSRDTANATFVFATVTTVTPRPSGEAYEAFAGRLQGEKTMFRASLIVAATASISFGAGLRNVASVRATAAIPGMPVSISPFEMQLNVNLQELPVQQVDYI